MKTNNVWFVLIANSIDLVHVFCFMDDDISEAELWAYVAKWKDLSVNSQKLFIHDRMILQQSNALITEVRHSERLHWLHEFKS